MQFADAERQIGKSAMRKSNLELLRIIAMIMIVAHHFSVHGDFSFSYDTITFNRLWVQFIQIGGKIGVDIFVIISGYFLISSQSLKTNKVIKLWLQLFTYSILIFSIFTAFGLNPFSVSELIKNCLPVTFSQWWFASSYFVLYLIYPYINKLLNRLSKKEYQRLLVLLTICWCIIPTFTTQSFQSNNLLWFIYLYSLAGYIRIFGVNNKSKLSSAVCISLSVIIIILTFLSAVLFDVMGMKYQFFAKNATVFYEQRTLPILLSSLLLFIGFLKMNMGYKRFINLIASATFGVYLIHDNYFVRSFIWEKAFKNSSYSESNILILYSLFVIAIVFAVCTIIELLRIYVLEKNYMGLVNSFAEVIDKQKEKFLSLSIFDKF